MKHFRIRNENALTLIGMLALATAYSTTVVPDFILLDGVTALDEAYRRDPQAAHWALALGRPLIAATMYWLYGVFDTIAEIKFIRMIGLAAVLGVFATFQRLAFARFMGRMDAFFLALAMCLLPPFVVSVYWAILPALPLGCILAGISMTLVMRAIADPVPDGVSLAGRFFTVRPAPFAGAVFFAFLAVFCYQPALFIATLLPLLFILTPGPANGLATTMRACAVTLVALSAGSALHLAVWLPYRHIFYGHIRQGDRYFMDSLGDVVQKLHWFFGDALPLAANLFRMDASGWLAAAILALCIGQFAVLDIPWRDRAVRALAWAMLMPVSYTANVMTAENSSTFRTLLGFQPFLFVSAAYGGVRLWDRALARTGLHRIRGNRNAVFIFATLILLGHQFLVRGPQITGSRVEELKVTRAAVTRLLQRNGVSRVVIVRADRNLNLSTLSRVTLLGASSAAPTWSVESLFRVVYVEAERALPTYEIVQMSTDEFENFEPTESDHVINFDSLLRDHLAALRMPMPRRQ